MISAKKVHSSLAKFHDLVEARLGEVKPELLCQLLYNNLRGDFFGFLDILYTGRPNANHRNIARMTHEFPIPAVLTTNFDVHIEVALHQAGCDCRLHVRSFPRRLRKSVKNGTSLDSGVQVVKIHGSLDDRASLVLTLRQAGLKLKEDLSELIRTVLTSYTVLVVGYSGNDDDIFPILLGSAKEAKEVYWVLWNNENSLTHSIRLFANACPNCTLVAADKESIFERLVDNVEGDSLESGVTEERTRQSDFLLR